MGELLYARRPGSASGEGWVPDVDDRPEPAVLIVRRVRADGVRARPHRVPYIGTGPGQVTRLVEAGLPWPCAKALVRALAAERTPPSRG